MKTFILLTYLTMAAATMLVAQNHHHDHHGHTMDTVKNKTAPQDTAKHDHKQHPKHGKDSTTHGMSHLYSRHLPMSRNGSGTAWLPDATPMYGYMLHSRRQWMFMFHGSLFLRYTNQDLFNSGSRGEDAFSAPNWVMGMAQKQVGRRGLLAFSMMLSADRLTDGGDGYPLLFQSGETWEGEPLIDRQHPHDLFSGLSVGYTHSFTQDIDLTLYAGYPGEPALGPVAFMHRISAWNNPDAPIGHHWQDATHIIFGVGTVGFRYKWLKAEGSIFTGREPDENRFNFDKPRFDSYSYRLMANPTENWAVQVSQAFINEPETTHPGEDVIRTTASVIHSIGWGDEKHLNSTLAYGTNNTGHGHNEHSILLESNWQWNRWALYGRYEWIQKSGEELGYDAPEMHDRNLTINAVTLGSSFRIVQYLNTNLNIGLQATAFVIDGLLKPDYGSFPVAAQVYLRISPGRMGM